MNTTRRRFLRTAAGTASLCLADGAALRGLVAFGAEPPPEKVRFGPDLEPIVRLIEETPREQCVRVFVAELRRGLPYRRFLAASLFAGIRRARSHHEVYKIHAVHQVGMDVRAEERLLPLFWALNGYKQRQEDFPLAAMTELRGSLPSPEKAAGEFRDAIQLGDRDRAELALVAMGRGQGARPTMEQLWQHGCRNGGAGGHMAIALANCFRALEAIGWQQAEPALRFVVQDWFALGYVKPDGYHQPNQARVDEHLKHLPSDWAGVRGDQVPASRIWPALQYIEHMTNTEAHQIVIMLKLGRTFGTHFKERDWELSYQGGGRFENNSASIDHRPRAGKPTRLRFCESMTESNLVAWLCCHYTFDGLVGVGKVNRLAADP